MGKSKSVASALGGRSKSIISTTRQLCVKIDSLLTRQGNVAGITQWWGDKVTNELHAIDRVMISALETI